MGENNNKRPTAFVRLFNLDLGGNVKRRSPEDFFSLLIGRKKVFFFILYHILLKKSSFGNWVAVALSTNKQEKIAYGTRSGDTDLCDHFREKHAANKQVKQPYKNRIWRSARKNGP